MDEDGNDKMVFVVSGIIIDFLPVPTFFIQNEKYIRSSNAVFLTRQI